MIATIIVPTYNRPQFLKDTLLSLQSQAFELGQCEIIVVDNGPTGEVEAISCSANEKGPHQVVYVREPKVGLHHARHAGAKRASGELLVYVDDDVITTQNWLNAILAPFDDSTVGIVGGKILPKWEASPPEWLYQFSLSYLSLLDMGPNSLELSWPKGVWGCNLAIRSCVLYQVGGFNPDGMGERRLIWLRGDGETGLHKKVYDAHYKVIYQPEAWIYHRIPASRLTPEYFYWRAFIQGISDSYSIARVSLSRAKMATHALSCFWWAARFHLSSLRHPESKSTRARAYYWNGRGQHQLRVALDRRLYDHVMQPAYL